MKTDLFRDAVSGVSEEYVIEVLENEPGYRKNAVPRRRAGARLAVLIAAALLAASLPIMYFALRDRGAEAPLPASPGEEKTGESPGQKTNAEYTLRGGLGFVLEISPDGRITAVRACEPEGERIARNVGCVGKKAVDGMRALASEMIREGCQSPADPFEITAEGEADYTLTEELLHSLDVLYITTLSDGRTLLRFSSAETQRAESFARYAEEQNISYARAEMILLLNERTGISLQQLDRQSLSQLREQCVLLDLEKLLVVQTDAEEAARIARNEIGAPSGKIYMNEERLYDASDPARCVGLFKDGRRFIVIVDLFDGSIIDSFEIQNELTKEQAEDLVLLRCGVDRIMAETVTVQTGSGVTTATVRAMSGELMRRERFTMCIDLRTGEITGYSRQISA